VGGLNEDTRSGGDVIGGEAEEDTPRSGGEGAGGGEVNEFEVFIIGENDSALPRGGEAAFDINDPNDLCLLTVAGGACEKAEGIGGLSFSLDTFLPVILDMNDLNDFADLGGSS
jgi:hypothetical protein